MLRLRESDAVVETNGTIAPASTPVVENGETSTIEAHTLKALMSAQPAISPDVGSGTNAASNPVVEANADTSPPMAQKTTAARGGSADVPGRLCQQFH